ncbi:SDR family NAD(P)-dependent oxidoreductase [Chitiniphilus purpureus]|uniref:SDR family NAD(P)-dependent oxidoreductase n=1 Tax=Chitiniphilus purpureus TaxID=2981137 RepID=A0ABY6DJK3_9NEIS|nr:SDR family NAD(P)-dependent oxidoreductase [Chitiniphilus sp. CD1]UXY13616.1 SDR family NAD(P)-dependent oxidoreductase [Chitiniphilus sp. CD1]
MNAPPRSDDTAADESSALLRDALNKIRQLKQALDAARRERGDDGIAVLGCGLRLPGGVHTLDGYARLLLDGHSTASPVPPSRWCAEDYYSADPEAPGKLYAQRAAFLDDVAGFDAAFFGISPREAVEIDPQHRLLLETVWEAMEDAGIAPEALRGSRTGVYVGLSMDDYLQVATHGMDLAQLSAANALGNARSLSAGRIAYTFDLTGPCLQLDTACSSSLVALHLARQALLAREIDTAIVAAANLIISPVGSIGFSRLKALSPDGLCKPFDAAADGYGRGEGVAALLLQRATDAQARGARLHGIVRGSAVNHDGRSNGLTAPNGKRQEDLLRAALDTAGIAPGQVRYVEAHGTGTPLGDPIELAAIGNVYARPDVRQDDLLVGSVKANVGHLEASAGLASLLKLLVIARGRTVPPMPHLHEPNSRVPWDRYRLRVPVVPERLDGPGPLLLAASCFGMSGTNAHVLLEAPPPVPRPDPPPGAQLLCLSARDPAALRALLQAYQPALAHPTAPLADLCCTAATGRNHFEWRIAFVARDTGDLAQQIDAALQQPQLGQRAVRAPQPALWFGPWPDGAGALLAQAAPPYRRQLAALYDTLGLGDTDLTPAQRAFLAQQALAHWLAELGVATADCAGDGTGHWVAAHQAGRMTLAEAFASAGKAPPVPPPAPLPQPVLLLGATGPHTPTAPLHVFDPASAPRAALLQLLQALYTLGVRIDWSRWYDPQHHRQATLPTYPFQRQPYWKHSTAPTAPIDVVHPLSGPLGEIVRQHRLFEVPVAPGALHLSLCHAALRPHGAAWLALHDVRFMEPLVMPPGTEQRPLRLHWSPERGEVSVASEGAAPHLKGQAVLHAAPLHETAVPDAPWPPADDAVAGESLYAVQAARGIDLGPLFRWITAYRVVAGEVFATLQAPADLPGDGMLALPPGLIDSCLHLLRVLLGDTPDTLIPVSIEHAVFRCKPAPGRHYRCHARLAGVAPDTVGALRLYDDSGLALAIDGLRAQAIAVHQLPQPGAAGATLFGWQAQPLPEPIADNHAVTDGAWTVIGATAQATAMAQVLAALGARVSCLPSAAAVAPTAPRPTDVLWFVPLDGTGGAAAIAGQIDTGLDLARRLAGPAPLRLYAMVSGDGETARLAYAALAALARGIGSELRSVQMRCWALPAHATPDVLRRLATTLRTIGHSALLDDAGQLHAHRLTLLPTAASATAPQWQGSAQLVTGAGGALGQALCRHLITKGVARLYLAGRQAPDTAALQAFARAQGRSCELIACALDVTDPDAVTALLADIGHASPPLRGIFHLAGVLQDRSVALADRASIDAVFAPKLLGAWHLHRASAGLPLDLFVCYSSVAAILSGAGQSVYAAANAALDGLCALRRAAGLPGRSLCWGPWDGAGMAGDLGPAARQAMAQLGMAPLQAGPALAGLDLALGRPDADVLIIACSRPEAIEAAALAAPSAPTPQPAGSAAAGEVEIAALAADIMGLGGQTLDPTLPLEDFGLDSLMSMELLEQLNARHAIRLPLTMRAMALSACDLAELVRAQQPGPTTDDVAPQRHLTVQPGAAQPARRLVCLHYLGGDAGCFAGWSARLDDDVSLLTVDWPRGGASSLTALAARIADELCALPPLPLYLYGHSMGSLLAYEVASRLDARHRPLLRAVVVGAMWTPDMHREATLRGPASIETLLHELHDDPLVPNTLLERNGWRAAAEADWQMMQAYLPHATPPLPCDLIALAGEHDPLVGAAHMQGWHRLCTADFEFHQLPGGHFFVHAADGVPGILRTLMARHESR